MHNICCYLFHTKMINVKKHFAGVYSVVVGIVSDTLNICNSKRAIYCTMYIQIIIQSHTLKW